MMPLPSHQAGELLRQHVDVSQDRTGQAALRARLVRAASRSPAMRDARWRWPGLATVIAIAAALFFWLRPVTSAAPLTFQVGADQQLGQLGVYYAAPEAGELPLRFSDGTLIDLEANSGARISHADALGAAVLLETGGAQLEVTARESSRWQIHAGPYTVRVTGTGFRIAWDVSSATLGLEMRSGSVVVQGPGIESGVTVRGGERFVSRASARVERAVPPSSSDDGTLADGQASPSAEGDTTQPAPTPSALPGSPTDPKPVASAVGQEHERALAAAPRTWTALVRRGDYTSVLREAEHRGIDRAIDGAGIEDLGALADAARFTGRHDVARRALVALRDRFAGSVRAASAAFLLGRMLDEGGDAAGALVWYDRYLAEAPAGALAAEALGRRMLALRRLGEREAATTAASGYLRRFPAGPYASVANELVTP